jgi:hypothetical protein
LHHAAQKGDLTQNEQTLISDEKAFSLRQADLGKAPGSTIERKQMSTKTTFKRVALVAVVSLGFGVLSSVSPASAASADNDIYTLQSATLDTATTTYAARIGQQIEIGVTGSVAASAAGATKIHALSIAATLTSQPAGSTIYPTIAGVTSALGTTLDKAHTGLVYDDSDAITTERTMAGTATTVATINYTGDTNNEALTAIAAGTTLAKVRFTPTVKGVYTLVVWNEANRGNLTVAGGAGTAMSASSQAALNGAESFQTFTINVVDSIAKVAISAINSTAAKDASLTGDDYGSLVKVTLTDAAGNLAIPATGETVILTPSSTGDITYVNNVAVTSAAGAAYSLSAADFGNTGIAWVNIANATAETYTVVATYTGSASASVSLTSRTIAAATNISPAVIGTSGFVAGAAVATAADATVDFPRGTSTGTFSVRSAYSADTASYGGFLVTDTAGDITGKAGLIWAPASTVVTDTDGLGTDGANYSVSWTASSTANETSIIKIETLGGTNQYDTVVSTIATSAGTATITPATINAVPGATVVVNVNLKDNFKRAYANQTLSASVTGRNPTTVNKTALTDSLGNASFSFTDANSTSVITSDVISVTGGSSAVTSTVLYGTANAPSTITLTSTGDTDVIPGTTKTDIDASATGATGKSATASAVVKNSAGSAVAGVAVTFTVTGLVGAEVHTTKATVYTDATGTAVSNISSYAAGKATVTATAGTATASDDIYFSQQTPTEARTIAVAATGGLVTATVKDRYGNVIEGVDVNATRTGTGYFGSGASTATGKTDKNGQVEFNFVGSGTVTVAFTSATYGQSYAAAGYDFDAVNGTAITAYTAGTSATNQKGLGGSLSPAGINSASVAVTGVDPATTSANAATAAAEAAADAAAEAIDAANAATDAANLAAEAADAATVAAEEARDAADAATAAVEELATQVATLMAALKAQITTLANTVAKIAKKVKA